MNSNLEKRVGDAVDREGLLRCLEDLVACRSVGGQETEVQHRVARWMRACGMDVDQWDIDFDDLRRHPAYTVEIERSDGVGVVGSFGAGSSPATLLLDGHVDVVPAGDAHRWSVPPWEATVRDGRVYGRGALDVKGGLSCALFAVKALRDARVALPGRVLVQSVIGEEDGGSGTLAAIVRGYRADAAIVIEPTGLSIGTAQAGALNFRITVDGRAAHACVRDEGESAVEHFLPIYEALKRLEEERNRETPNALWDGYRVPFAISIGTVRAGEWSSTVPESLIAEGRFGIAPDESLEQARRQFEDAIANVQGDAWLTKHPPTVAWWGAQFAPAVVAEDHPIVTTLRDATEVVRGAPPAIVGAPYGSNARLLVHEGATPAVLFGPGDIRLAHAPDEWVAIEDLLDATRILAVTILRACG